MSGAGGRTAAEAKSLPRCRAFGMHKKLAPDSGAFFAGIIRR
jgi:hypothetical protein